ncbi:hypothetical protein Tsubulata_038137 [Turnera subulata]|uniref:BZIP domain-containing protein n=1 Tax=Turnera subulata TaxID=218843 RepID=A0A9Q0JDQ9_9ROSI|nr:hypothetical protein Tsubulata_037323 [Turnera subulata]KAJ4840119.1 hypothetical protein Tsubulata_038137 [Turnera subulata]
MLLAQEAVHLDYPVYPFHEPAPFTSNELQELLSLFQSSPTCSQNSGSDGSNPAVHSEEDDRKRRRMISNRESARRSRWRKKRHLENLTEQVNRLQLENQELKNRLGSVLNRSHVLCTENNQLLAESVALQARLSDLRRVLVAMRAMQHHNNIINNHHR